MRIEERWNQQRIYLQSEKSPRQHIKTSKAKSPNEELQRIYTKTIYNKYNHVMDILASKQQGRENRSKENIQSEYHQILKLGVGSGEKALKPVSKNQLRIRKYDLGRRSSSKGGVGGLFGTVKPPEDGIKFSANVDVLQNIYKMPPPPKPIKVQPIGISTKSTYFGIQPFDRNPSIWLEGIKTKITDSEDVEAMETLLKGMQLM